MKLNYHNRFTGPFILIIFLMITTHTTALNYGEYEVTVKGGFKGTEIVINFTKNLKRRARFRAKRRIDLWNTYVLLGNMHRLRL